MAGPIFISKGKNKWKQKQLSLCGISDKGKNFCKREKLCMNVNTSTEGSCTLCSHIPEPCLPLWQLLQSVKQIYVKMHKDFSLTQVVSFSLKPRRTHDCFQGMGNNFAKYIISIYEVLY